MGSGSDNHFRLDLPASVAKPAGDELLVFREDRRKEKKKSVVTKEHTYWNHTSSLENKEIIFCAAIFLQYGFIV